MGAPGLGDSNIQSAAQQFVEQAKEYAADKAFIKADRMADAQAAARLAPQPAPVRVKVPKQKLKNRKGKVEKAKQEVSQKDKIEKTKGLKQSAKEFEQKYGQQFLDQKLNAKTLGSLKESIKPSDTPEEILQKVQTLFSDVSAQDIAFEFLIENTEAGDLLDSIIQARDLLNQAAATEIKAGRNIARQAARYGKEVGKDAGYMREVYRDYSKRQPTAEDARKELRAKYPTHNERVKMIKYLERAFAEDIKSEGPSMPRAKLNDYVQQIKRLQAGAHVDKEMHKQMKLMKKKFDGVV